MKPLSRIFSILLVLLVLSSVSFAADVAYLLPGTYVVGVDIAAGSYNLVPDMGGDEDQLWSFAIYHNANSKKEYQQAIKEYNEAYFAAKDAGKPYPSSVDRSLYILEAEYTDFYLANHPMRITLTDGQAMELIYIRYHGKLKIKISKAEAIFID